MPDGGNANISWVLTSYMERVRDTALLSDLINPSFLHY
jgi:hypothetical protein